MTKEIRLAKRLIDEAVTRVGGRQAWARLCLDAQHEQVSVSAFNVINSRFDAVDNDRPVVADVMAAHATALDLWTL